MGGAQGKEEVKVDVGGVWVWMGGGVDGRGSGKGGWGGVGVWMGGGVDGRGQWNILDTCNILGKTGCYFGCRVYLLWRTDD